MFQVILQSLSSERMIDKNRLAREIGVSVAVLQDMLDLLVARGYLRTDRPTACSTGHCAGCSFVDHCSDPTEGVTYFVLTEKGRRYIEGQPNRSEKTNDAE